MRKQRTCWQEIIRKSLNIQDWMKDKIWTNSIVPFFWIGTLCLLGNVTKAWSREVTSRNLDKSQQTWCVALVSISQVCEKDKDKECKKEDEKENIPLKLRLGSVIGWVCWVGVIGGVEWTGYCEGEHPPTLNCCCRKDASSRLNNIMK